MRLPQRLCWCMDPAAQVLELLQPQKLQMVQVWHPPSNSGKCRLQVSPTFHVIILLGDCYWEGGQAQRNSLMLHRKWDLKYPHWLDHPFFFQFYHPLPSGHVQRRSARKQYFLHHLQLPFGVHNKYEWHRLIPSGFYRNLSFRTTNTTPNDIFGCHPPLRWRWIGHIPGTMTTNKRGKATRARVGGAHAPAAVHQGVDFVAISN